MKNLSKIIADVAGKPTDEQAIDSIEYQGLFFNMEDDQVVFGETRKESVGRTISFFSHDLPMRIMAVIESRPVLMKRLCASLVRRKTMVNLGTSIDTQGRVITLYQEEDLVFFDESAISLLVELTQDEITAEIKHIQNKQRQIYMMCEITEERRRFMVRTLQMSCWARVAQSLPRPAPKPLPVWPSL